ncbi:ABC transporter permease subunit [Clostridium tyrobutyricum]|jgi:NitT/TauT family transport system permease protein|uniref:ABC transporter permease n=1 Tax=Clostridium tyrobutyricum TaxID=1519 RepID=UPI0002FA4F26|nr:ABC transporter permease subunit [Clostridium tyrobutyricum]MBV4421402.1 ABC transporter permease subunit [Clostridium tyrobutyricum]MBV4427259.1 ABC transporter permease subunit [Clostridium tyrobutyricum]MBV4430082.1 ABC transporter permease subunit [Clostridium tyrobutyricum]MBV4436997.1 ABC transporter permease subunit [Clostridium tyrobutyricum]MBV4439638.1 ABC transporter permease subunit [Clostridium tyrobutyricum]
MKISTIVEPRIIRKPIILLFWIIIWEVCSKVVNSPILLPSPFEVIKAFISLAAEVYFWKSIFQSLFRVILGISISVFGGIVLGIFAGLNKFVEDLLEPVIVTVKATPVISIIIIALVWFTSSKVVVFTAILICFPIVYTNVLEGIRSIDGKLIEMANIYKVKKRYILIDIYLPGIKNYIVSGIVMCLGIGWKVSVASEVLSTPKYSIGLNLLNSKTMLETSELFAWTVTVILMSFIFEKVFRFCLREFRSENV